MSRHFSAGKKNGKQVANRGVAWDFEGVRKSKLGESGEWFSGDISKRHFGKDISINEKKLQNTRSSYDTTNAL